METAYIAKVKHEANRMINNTIRQMLNALRLFPDGVATMDDLERTIDYVSNGDIAEHTITSPDGKKLSIVYTSYIFDLMFDYMTLLGVTKLDAKIIVDNSDKFYKEFYKTFLVQASNKINGLKNLGQIKGIDKN